MEKFFKFIFDHFWVYSIIAGLFALGSFLIIHKGNRASAENSKNEIQDKVTEATSAIVDSTKTALEIETGKAINEITSSSKAIQKQIDEQLAIVNKATSDFKNLMENQKILVQVTYTFYHPTESTVDTNEAFWKTMKAILTNNNVYDLDLILDKNSSYFKSDNNSFVIFSNMNDSKAKERFENAFVNSIYDHEKLWEYRPQKLEINYVLDAMSLKFNLNDLKEGNKIKFRLKKQSFDGQQNPDLQFKSNDYFKINGFKSFFAVKGEEKIPGEIFSKMEIKIKMRNGKSLFCEYKGSIEIDAPSGSDFHFGFESSAVITKIE